MKRFLVSIFILSLFFISACTYKPRLDFEGFYRFKLTSSFKECTNLLDDNKIDYEIHEIHDKHGNGVILSIDNAIQINNRGVYLALAFPDEVILRDKYVDYNSKVLLSFSYGVNDIDLEYARSFLAFFTKYLGAPMINQFEESSKDSDVKFVHWDNDLYSISCVANLKKDMETSIHITFGMTDDQRILFEKKQF